jgi:WD40 repeat protein
MLNAIISKDLAVFDETNLLNKRFPEINISLQHVYGFQSYDRRNTLIYAEDYDEEWFQPEYGRKKFYNLNQNSQRLYCYFVSRVVVVCESIKLSQKFYEGHKFKVSCMKVHPSRKIIASGETSENPSIHIWETRDCSPLKVIKTQHGAGIINLAWSSDGSVLISIGMDKFFSI